jgi:hypothetical protein
MEKCSRKLSCQLGKECSIPKKFCSKRSKVGKLRTRQIDAEEENMKKLMGARNWKRAA